jgi:hypothetical protein
MNDKENLEQFLLDIDILNELDQWNKDVNFFEVTDMVNKEIKHSNLLSWLFDPNGTHNLEDQVIKRFLQKVLTTNLGINQDMSIFDVSLVDFSRFKVKREYKNIDILIFSDELKLVFAIENKIYAKESKAQLLKYKDTIDKEFTHYKKMYIFLTREGIDPSDIDHWNVADYKMIVDSIEETIKSGASMSINTKMILTDYTQMIRRNLIMDKELQDICFKIYNKHRKALDLIYQVTQDMVSIFSDHIKNWFIENHKKYEITYDPQFTTKTYVRFTTKLMDELFPYDEKKEDSWGYGYSFMYEIRINNYGVDIFGYLANPNRPNSDLLVKHSQQRSNKEIWKWKRIMAKKNILTRDEMSEGLTEEMIGIIHKRLDKIIKKDIDSFEKSIKIE